ncbi:MAG TPA: hypothetical protein RMH85_08705 [Polyangiaceae bacterium LLY-WYZ-15_(1-7)]|nr:hypothetical protein [Sandaracinus sp.]HJK94510.1 hypothetical protein [Polyangiaceae bacterium LLY-WYZ-15_(1-7)]MBJ70887.1 hypothetical protein [Sandaracinus sp.]HJL01418.1 hypothetical protein [Polyangiaceae bacterium LLY-WYZ-15_(1-7)]HJL08563.1 hypothetical protein [Polyangiaceae bacterium LLY-WYZ-15_(1-7)]
MTNPTTKRSRGAARAWPILVALALAAGCDDGREDFERFVAEEEAREAAEAAAAAARAAAEPAEDEAPPITLAPREVADMGVTLSVPEDARTLAASAASTTFSKALPGGLHELNVQVRGYGAANLEAARADATMMGGSVSESETLEDGRHQVVLAPQGVLQRVFVYTAERSAKCTGPTAELDRLREICASLQPSS